jgi:hypothetical protein
MLLEEQKQLIHYEIKQQNLYCIHSSAIALGPAVYSASSRNEYQKQRNNIYGE